MSYATNDSEDVSIYCVMLSSLSGTDHQGSQHPAVHPPDQGHRPGHNLLPLVLGVLPYYLPRLLSGL